MKEENEWLGSSKMCFICFFLEKYIYIYKVLSKGPKWGSRFTLLYNLIYAGGGRGEGYIYKRGKCFPFCLVSLLLLTWKHIKSRTTDLCPVQTEAKLY